ncbi:MarR family winged helix-turn-helix transcriptional regulator [Mycolicibacterium palauense]|uniref:MarR family winged helix-turn-helix transcriptional regulator n=1 Tax=Mycolicibacterium palauense TaxID=2034511 RepID=UPI001FE341CB|nr:MarR family transcriptional regulator [Mycolicibacterium palauense]
MTPRAAPPEATDRDGTELDEYAAALERATRGLLDLNVVVLEHMERRIGLVSLRALQALQRLGPSQVTALGQELGLVPSTASRLSDRLATAGLISREVSPLNRRATILELTAAGEAILAELVHLRVRLFREVADEMAPRERTALLHGAAAFTEAQLRATEPSAQIGPPEIPG